MSISAFVTNLVKYSEGEWVELPATYYDIRQVFNRIGIDGVYYIEYFITDYETSIDDLYNFLPEHANLNELNYLAANTNPKLKEKIVRFFKPGFPALFDHHITFAYITVL